MMSQTNKRRLRTYSRRIRAIGGAGLRHRCFFMHIPKCGGTSISEALYATVPIHKRVGVVDANSTRRATAMYQENRNELFLYHDDLPNGDAVFALREQMLLAHMAWDTELIHGHILFSKKADRHFGDRYKYVTMLREPVARFISNYNGSVGHGLTKTDFSTYLDGETARLHALSALRYFNGEHHIPENGLDDAIRSALDVSRKFSVIGFLDRVDAFCDDFQNTFGIRPKVFRYNEAKTSSYKPTEDEMKRVADLLAPEIEFWDRIRAERNPSSR